MIGRWTALGELLHLLRDLRISLEEDAVIWKGEGHGRFRIRNAYKLLSGSNVITFPKKSIWVDKVPTKVAFFGLGGFLGESPNFGQASKTGMAASKLVFFVWL
ncbi:hypothetical protein CK203_109260 [Vitis vinifera]|uniref:Uncharacterized protein n=1 Tax=Vitis vinifera TaxID=29760 RepID=A0A438CCA8_VITVI|nr:hypothetical protein CK203_109260 [Vitis vinifera]